MNEPTPAQDFASSAKAHLGIAFTLHVHMPDGSVIDYPCTGTLREVETTPPPQGVTP